MKIIRYRNLDNFFSRLRKEIEHGNLISWWGDDHHFVMKLVN